MPILFGDVVIWRFGDLWVLAMNGGSNHQIALEHFSSLRPFRGR
jgi:hypothetical protein